MRSGAFPPFLHDAFTHQGIHLVDVGGIMHKLIVVPNALYILEYGIILFLHKDGIAVEYGIHLDLRHIGGIMLVPDMLHDTRATGVQKEQK